MACGVLHCMCPVRCTLTADVSTHAGNGIWYDVCAQHAADNESNRQLKSLAVYIRFLGIRDFQASVMVENAYRHVIHCC